jgi:cysteinyl-tRNA synthetase
VLKAVLPVSTVVKLVSWDIQMAFRHNLQITNNLTRRKEAFVPIDPKRVRMYVCGMTVYDYCHIGHARVMVVFDVVNRYLRQVFGEQHVTYVRNITDIDDKIIKRAPRSTSGRSSPWCRR